MIGYHLVVLPKHDDPAKAILAACTEKQLIKLAAKQLNMGKSFNEGDTALTLPFGGKDPDDGVYL